MFADNQLLSVLFIIAPHCNAVHQYQQLRHYHHRHQHHHHNGGTIIFISSSKWRITFTKCELWQLQIPKREVGQVVSKIAVIFVSNGNSPQADPPHQHHHHHLHHHHHHHHHHNQVVSKLWSSLQAMVILHRPGPLWAEIAEIYETAETVKNCYCRPKVRSANFMSNFPTRTQFSNPNPWDTFSNATNCSQFYMRQQQRKALSWDSAFKIKTLYFLSGCIFTSLPVI